MGYTHYWKFKQNPKDIKGGDKKFKKAVELFKKCISIHPFALAGGDGTGEPIIKNNELCFNGVDDDSYETCYFALDNKGYDFDFCKTARKPYDGAVCLAILCFKKAFGKDFSYSSDGDSEDEGWKLANEVFSKC